MSKALRIGILGMTHDHVWDVLRHAHEVADMQIVAAADPSEELRTAATMPASKRCLLIISSYSTKPNSMLFWSWAIT